MYVEEKLIDEVRQNEVLYNQNHEHYRNCMIKEKIWKVIALNLHQDVDYCKKRWKSLRDTYKKWKRLLMIKSEDGLQLKKKWRYAKRMSFLDEVPSHRLSPKPIEDVNSLDEMPIYAYKFEFDETQTLKSNASGGDYASGDDAFQNPSPTPNLKQEKIFSTVHPNLPKLQRDERDEVTQKFVSFLDELAENIHKIGETQNVPPTNTSTHKFCDFIATRIVESNLTRQRITAIENKILMLVNRELADGDIDDIT